MATRKNKRLAARAKRSPNSARDDRAQRTLEASTVGWFAMIATSPHDVKLRIAEGLHMLANVLERMAMAQPKAAKR